ncbi:MAG: hypothetical protein H7174_01510, partial [Flavobacterium sp.]|nr:hypothetical protein [Flavobacterium sp.]
CSKDELEVPVYTSKGTYDSGVLVLNEGKFTAPNASISFISFDSNTVQNNIFSGVNPSSILGVTAQSIGINGDLAYIVLNGSNKIQIVNRFTMVNVGSITTGLNNPRYTVFANGKGYVTNWGDTGNKTDDFVAILNLSNNTVSSIISVVEGPEQIVNFNGNIYVSHKGGYGFGNSISVINTSTDAVTNTISVGDLPNTMVVNNGALWVMCEGIPSPYNPVTDPAETGGKLLKISLTTNSITDTFSFGTTSHPSNLTLYNDKLYYTLGSSVFGMALTPVAPATSIALPTSSLFNTNAISLYGFAIKTNKIYVADAKDFDSNGTVTIYSLGEISGSPILGSKLNSHQVGVSPNGFYFNQ